MESAYAKGLLREVSRRLRSEGLLTTVRKAVRYVVGKGGSVPRQDEFDRVRGIYTKRTEPLWRLGLTSAERESAQEYQAIEPKMLTDMLMRLESDWSRSTFVDLGCGKGRALIVAAEAGFGRARGVELSKKLVKIARRNIARLRLDNIEVVHGDAGAASFEVDNTVLYMYNPFGDQVMREVRAKIDASPTPPSHILYFNPFYTEALDSLARYEVVVDDPIVKVWHRL